MLRGLYNWTMAKAAHPHAQWWLAFFSFIESSFFPIPPHPLLGLMCLAEPKRAIRYAAICTAASVLGGLFGYMIGFFLYEAVGEWLIGALGLTDSFPAAACYIREQGAIAVFLAAGTPIPFKLMTITAGFIEMNLVTFLIAAIAGRALIFMVVGVLFQFFGAPIKAIIDKYLGTVTTIFVVLVVGGFLAITQLGGGHDDTGASDDPCANVTSMEDVRAQ
ncbi:YqaA family protein [Aurantiacibacter rhizosphaerae]|uniref:DedA family protein n=1 Tax=Aurantiacibacter rhizosphaerae TaxID=2691582 RepID=A0A844XGV7_9SPHN|nr:VTT domain-containing protein [Aurantiacibacter rhizosphaerae]MWV28765.1 DedA family protein [Aurantiacibacter rhizosphaerae]